MRALVLDGTGVEHLRIERVPTPRPRPRQLLARVDAAGICASLLKLIDQGPVHPFLYGWDPARWPLVLGDEGSITLVEVGEELRDRYAPGERYVIQPAVVHPPVNHRERYLAGVEGVDKVAVGYTLPGHLAEYVLVPEETLGAGCLLPVPDRGLPFAHAAMAEPISCVLSAQDHHVHLEQASALAPRSARKGLKAGGVVVVVGAGPMGRIHVDLALAARPRAVVVVDRHRERLERVASRLGSRAAALGAVLATVDIESSDPAPLVDELSGGHGADDVIVAVASPDAIRNAQRLLARGGVLDLFGGLKRGEDLVPLDTTAVHYRELIVTGSSGGSPWDVARALELMAAGEVDPAAHIARIGDLEHAPELLELVRTRRIEGKAVVYPHRRLDDVVVVDSWTAADEAAHLAAR